MKKMLKTVILLPFYPLIWVARMIEPEEYRDGNGWSCGSRARIMMNWRER